jgi:1-pyrroline-5-carboxylate dehydrogenase
MDSVTNVPFPTNEPLKGYAPGSAERTALETRIKDLEGERAELTMTIGGQQRMGGGDVIDVVQPHNHRHVLGQLREATDADVAAAVDAALQAAPSWRALSFDDRAAIFLKAADLLSGPWRQTLNAATVLGSPSPPSRPRSTRPAN